MEYLVYKSLLSIRFSFQYLFLNGEYNLKSIQVEMLVRLYYKNMNEHKDNVC